MKSKRQNSSGLVYSTGHGKMCPRCANPVDECVCSNKIRHAKSDGIVRLSRETKGRRGKGVTIITGVPLDSHELKVLAKELKQKCGSGGTVKSGTIEIQGDHREMLMDELKVRGYTVKRAGG